MISIGAGFRCALFTVTMRKKIRTPGDTKGETTSVTDRPQRLNTNTDLPDNESGSGTVVFTDLNGGVIL